MNTLAMDTSTAPADPYGPLAELIPPALRARWPARPLPLHRHAIHRTGLLAGRDLLVHAATGAGKTFVGEVAALMALTHGEGDARGTAFVVPTRALASELHACLTARYGPAGVRVLLSTSDHRDDDGELRAGRFDMAVTVYEKLGPLLARRDNDSDGDGGDGDGRAAVGFRARLGALVLDEVHTLLDAKRGAAADLTVAGLLHGRGATMPGAVRPPRVVALTATLPTDALPALAAWLGADTIRHRGRPVILREGVYRPAEGTFRYREWPGAPPRVELLVRNPPGPSEDSPFDGTGEPGPHLSALVSALLAEGDAIRINRFKRLPPPGWNPPDPGGVLVFAPTRARARRVAWDLSRENPWPPGSPAKEALAALEHHEPTAARRLLAGMLERGVAFHTTDLTHEARALVEHAFRTGAVRVLVATGTLAQGVNLNAAAVVHVSPDAGPAPLDLARFRNQGGRAGRPRDDLPDDRDGLAAAASAAADARGDLPNLLPPPPARSIAVADVRDPDGRHARRLDERFAPLARWRHPHPPLAVPPATPTELAPLALRLTASAGPGGTGTAALTAALAGTLRGHLRWASSPRTLAGSVERALAGLISDGLVTREPATGGPATGDGAVFPTPLGRLAAARGFHPATAADFRRWITRRGPLRGDGGGPPPPMIDYEPLFIASATADGRDHPCHPAPRHTKSRVYYRLMRQRLEGLDDGLVQMLRRSCPPHFEGMVRAQGDIRRAAMAEAWLSDAPTAAIEREHHDFEGTLREMARRMAWLTEGLADAAEILGAPAWLAEGVRDLALRLPGGLPAEGVGLAPLAGVAGVSRGHLRALLADGLATPADIHASPDDRLLASVPAPALAALRAAAARLAAQAPSDGGEAPTVPHEPPPRRPAAARHRPTADGDVHDGPVRRPACAEPADPDDGPALVLDPASPGMVRFDGADIALPPLPYRLLALLAGRPGAVISYEAISTRLWPDAQVEQQQIPATRRRLLRALAAGTRRPPDALDALVTVHPGQGLRMTLAEDRIRIAAAARV